MKNRIFLINPCILLMLIVVQVPSFAADDASEKRWDSLETMAHELSKLSEQISPAVFEMRTLEPAAVSHSLSEFETFQTSLVTAMVTDPVYNENRQAVSDRALQLTAELKENLKSLQKFTATAGKFGIEKDFKEYLSVVSAVIREREQRHYTVARAKLKELMLSQTFARLQKSVKGLKTGEISSASASVSRAPAKVKPEFAKLLGTLIKAQNTLALLRDENLQNIASLENNKLLASKNEETYARLSKRAAWIEKIAWWVMAMAAFSVGVGSYLLIQRFLGFLGLLRVPSKSLSKQASGSGQNPRGFGAGANLASLRNGFADSFCPRDGAEHFTHQAKVKMEANESSLVEGEIPEESSGVLERLYTTATDTPGSNIRPVLVKRAFTRWIPPVTERRGFIRADFSSPAQVRTESVAIEPQTESVASPIYEDCAQAVHSTVMENYLPDYIPQDEERTEEALSFVEFQGAKQAQAEVLAVDTAPAIQDSEEEYLNEPMVFAAPNVQIVEEPPVPAPPIPRASKARSASRKIANTKRRGAEPRSWSLREHADEDSGSNPGALHEASGSEPALHAPRAAKKSNHSVWDRDPLKDIFDGII